MSSHYRYRACLTLVSCILVATVSTGCRTGMKMPSMNMFAWKGKSSADNLAVQGPTTKYPAPPSQTARPNAIASAAAGTANRGVAAASGVRSNSGYNTPGVSGLANGGYATNTNNSAAAANGFQASNASLNAGVQTTPYGQSPGEGGYRYGSASSTAASPSPASYASMAQAYGSQNNNGATANPYPGSTDSSYGASTPNAYGSSDPVAYGSPAPNAYGSSDPVAYGSSDPVAYGSPAPNAYGSSDPVAPANNVNGTVNDVAGTTNYGTPSYASPASYGTGSTPGYGSSPDASIASRPGGTNSYSPSSPSGGYRPGSTASGSYPGRYDVPSRAY